MSQRRLRRAVVPGLGIAVLLSGASVRAQDSSVLDAGFEAVRNKQRFLVSGMLALTEKEAGAFWAEYDRFEARARKLDERSARLITELAASLETLSEARARALVEEHLSIEEARLRELRTHVSRLEKVLPAGRLARYVQLRNKLDLGVRCDLLQQIPLVQ